MSILDNYTVSKIPSKETYPWLLKKHYARRIPSISFAFGLYKDKELCGILTVGTPSSSPLREGVCGKENINYVYELNRLCVNDGMGRNVLSYFVGQCLKMLPPMILISYADTSQGHNGYIYQSTNWLYTGLSAKRTDWKIKGKEHLHGQTIADEFRGVKNRAEAMRAKYGNDFYLKDRPRKHRYVYFIGNKKQKKCWKASLLYNEEPYPKGENSRYDASFKPQTQMTFFE